MGSRISWEFNVVPVAFLLTLFPRKGLHSIRELGHHTPRDEEDVSIWHGEVKFPLILFLCPISFFFFLSPPPPLLDERNGAVLSYSMLDRL